MMDLLWVGGHPGVDLANTVVAIDDGLVDLLPDWPAVVRWAVAADLVDGDHPRTGSTDHLRRAVALREGLRAAMDEGDHGRLDAALADVPVRLRAADAPLVTAPAGSHPAEAVLAALARVVADASRLPAHRVRRCAGERCVLHFNDTTRGGRRRWCDMTTCGNRAKQAALRARRGR
jgi:predicted RNA-binding Zn ribbon-like protein